MIRSVASHGPPGHALSRKGRAIPFFGKSDRLLVIGPDGGSREFHANTDHTTETMCDVILKTGVQRLVLGFIAEPAARKLRAAGVDIRLGSCACAVEDLVSCFGALPTL